MTTAQKYAYFKSALLECSSPILKESDKMVECHLFEDCSVDAVSFLHRDTLEALLAEGWIDEGIREKSLSLRERFLSPERMHPERMNVGAVRNTDEWRTILRLSDEILSLLSI